MRPNLYRVLASAGLVAGAAAWAAPAGATGPGAPGAGGVLVPAFAHETLPVHGGTAASLNWSGYAVTPGSGVTGVTTQFVVPSASPVPPGFAATWAGIGGYNTSDLIQAGVGENSTPSNPLLGPQYYAWYEMLPASETPITGCTGDASCTVTPGDKVSVDISQASGNRWNISMSDGSKWTWSKQVTYASSGSSAEWILEAPTVAAQTLLADVGTVHFGSNDTYTAGGATHTIAAGNPTMIDLGTGVLNEATPSALAADGESFNDCAYAVSCPAP